MGLGSTLSKISALNILLLLLYITLIPATYIPFPRKFFWAIIYVYLFVFLIMPIIICSLYLSHKHYFVPNNELRTVSWILLIWGIVTLPISFVFIGESCYTISYPIGNFLFSLAALDFSLPILISGVMCASRKNTP